ncbi:MAG: HAMP domain-containing sensor histidine kinase [Bacteroidota bacterium]
MLSHWFDGDRKLAVWILVFNSGLLVLDTITARGYAEWILYILPVLLLTRASKPGVIYSLGGVSVLFLLTGFLLSPMGVDDSITVVNRSICGLLLLAVIAAISKQKQREWKLESFDLYKQAVIDAAPLGAHMYEVNTDGILQFKTKNRYAIETLNGTLNPGGHTAPGELYPSTLRLVGKEIVERIARNGGEWSEFVAVHEGANERFFEVHVVMIRPGDLGVFFRDVSEIRRAELAERKARELSEQTIKLKDHFIATISHEIRTPLNIILGYISLLREQELAGQEFTNDCFESILAASTRLTRTVDLILSNARLRAGELKPQWEYVDLNRYLKMSVEKMATVAAKKQLDLRYQTFEPPVSVRLDEYLFGQALHNFLDNAIKFTPRGVIDVFVTPETHGDGVVVTIQDEGIGISQDFLPMLYNAYSQESIGYSRNYEGLGLGMSIAREYLELMGMRIAVESAPGAGTKVYVQIPERLIRMEVDNSPV